MERTFHLSSNWTHVGARPPSALRIQHGPSGVTLYRHFPAETARASEDRIQTLPVHSKSLPSKTEEKRWVCLRQGEPTGGPQNLDAAPKAVFLGQEEQAGSEDNHVVLLFVLGAGCTGSCLCLIFLDSSNLPQLVIKMAFWILHKLSILVSMLFCTQRKTYFTHSLS